jgi:hypothetical protein
MFAANDSSSRGGLRHALAGLQAGVSGALTMLGCLMIGSLLESRSIWLVPNLLATTFFGSDAYRNQFAHTTWSGVALIVTVYGLLGMIWGVIWGDSRKQWLPLYGAIAGLAVYFLFYRFAWKHVNPLVTLYAPDRLLEAGHIVWGLIVARSPRYSRRIALATVEPAIPEAVQEVRSGEVIR